MTKSKQVFNTRCRPLFGTLVRVHLDAEEDRCFDFIYNELAEVERAFNFFDPASEVSEFNRANGKKMCESFLRVLRFSLQMRDVTDRAFTPFFEEQDGERLCGFPVKIQEDGWVYKNEPCTLDFGGVAKGFAVDQAVEKFTVEFPDHSGFIEAGGDVRYFGAADRLVSLRLGVPPKVVHRELRMTKNSIATSAPGAAQSFGPSKTRYPEDAVNKRVTVVVMADNCMLADALTKAAHQKVSANAETLIFDDAGELVAP